MIMTGQAQTAAYTQAQFKSYVCGQHPGAVRLQQCLRRRRELSGLHHRGDQQPIDGGGNFVNNMKYSPGGPGDIVVVRLFYQWPLFVTGLGYNISNLSGSKRLLTATAAFRNEPY